MKKLSYSKALIEQLTDLTTRIMESPVQFMSPNELEGGIKLTEEQFLARVEKYIKDPETDIPGDSDSIEYTTGLLAKMYHKGLERTVVMKYMIAAPIRKGGTTQGIPYAETKGPLKHAAKKRKIESLRRQLDKHKKP